MTGRITVMDVFREMKLDPEPSVSWRVGAAVRALYEKRNGALPEKELRRKTHGGGSHCFAAYPPEMREEIERIIRAHQPETSPQGSLF